MFQTYLRNEVTILMRATAVLLPNCDRVYNVYHKYISVHVMCSYMSENKEKSDLFIQEIAIS